MNIAGTIARILLGLLFVFAGLNGIFAWLGPPPPGMMPHDMEMFTTALISSHYVWLTAGVQVICGVLLLLDRYMTLTIVVLGAVLVNILAIHITMFIAGIPMALVATALWFLAAWPIREKFAFLFRP